MCKLVKKMFGIKNIIRILASLIVFIPTFTFNGINSKAQKIQWFVYENQALKTFVSNRNENGEHIKGELNHYLFLTFNLIKVKFFKYYKIELKITRIVFIFMYLIFKFFLSIKNSKIQYNHVGLEVYYV